MNWHDISDEERILIGHASTVERVCDTRLDRMPHGEARAIIEELTKVSEFLREQAKALPRVAK